MKSGKTAIVTGGAKGIGYHLSRRLASHGWNLILCGRDPDALKQVASECETVGGVRVQAISLDLASPGAAQTFFEKLGDAPLPGALVCNAGSYGELGKLADVDFTEWKRSYDLNFFSVAELIQQYLRAAKKAQSSAPVQRRKIVVMSGSGLGGSKVWPGVSAYACSKAALYRLVEVVHEEVHTDGIDINCVAPGAVKTGITDQAERAGRAALGALYDETLKVKEKGGDSPEFAANVIGTLLSEKCDGLSGRLISAKWDGRFLESPAEVSSDPDLLRLRRIDNELFGKMEKKK